MGYEAECMACVIRKYYSTIEHETDEVKKREYMQEVLRAVLKANEEETPVIAVARLDKLYEKMFNKKGNIAEEKKQFNDLLLGREKIYWKEIQEAEDPLLAALKFSRAGNYIDTSALSYVDYNTLDELLERAVSEEFNQEEYVRFQAELEGEKKLVLLCDNTGEIVLDKLLVKVLKEKYPKLQIKAIVRGEQAQNDATIEDAEYVGLTDVIEVMGNGSFLGATKLDMICEEALHTIQEADVILAKGQGNTEALLGCGLNIYYSFLCKCGWFMRRFQMEPLKGVFANERRMS